MNSVTFPRHQSTASAKHAPQRIRGFLNDMRYINARFTYLLTYLLTYYSGHRHGANSNELKLPVEDRSSWRFLCKSSVQRERPGDETTEEEVPTKSSWVTDNWHLSLCHVWPHPSFTNRPTLTPLSTSVMISVALTAQSIIIVVDSGHDKTTEW